MGRTYRCRKQRLKLAAEHEQSKDESFLPDLYKYLSSLQWKNESRLTARNFPLTGRGLCSKQAICGTEPELIRLPIDALLTIKTLEDDEGFREMFDEEKFDKDHKISFQSLMAFYVLYQMALGQESPFKPYLKSLPTYFSTPYFCPIAELQCLPENILERTVEQNRLIKESYKNLKIVLRNAEDFELKYPMAQFRWSYFVVNTRSVYVLGKQIKSDKLYFQNLLSEDYNLALAPFLDLFNHSDLVQTEADVMRHTASKQLEFVLTLANGDGAKIPAYRQIFISYGALSNLKLLTEYGFFLPSNRHDLFEFSLMDIENFLHMEKSFKGRVFHKNKFKFIRDHNLCDQMFVHQHEGVSHNLQVVLHLLFKEESHFPNILNQVAFGSIENLQNVNEEVGLLLKFKVKEYEMYIKSLESLRDLTKSGYIAKMYLQECLRYMDECLLGL
ncbi:SET domain-containing protein 4 [Stomoxys calcitrans]|uniref:SET domain-containing protein 4 n=1 Tax=Stomoxys calcitrans TaxID=35570 RepID=UPI0027E34A82|nr:SET domain-containing protein 4 [Stomoxys calcitrans]